MAFAIQLAPKIAVLEVPRQVVYRNPVKTGTTTARDAHCRWLPDSNESLVVVVVLAHPASFV